MSANLRNYVKTLYGMDAVVRRVPEAAWDAPSPCEGWSGREVLGHTVWGMKRMTAGITGQAPPAEQAEADVVGSDPVGSWTAAFDAMLVALDQQGALDTVIPTPFGEMPTDSAIGALFLDPLIHTYDLAKTAGIDHAIDEVSAQKCLEIMEPLGDNLRAPGLFDQARPVADDASAVERLIAFTGRDL